jgi:hypothetical protein
MTLLLIAGACVVFSAGFVLGALWGSTRERGRG